MVLEMIEFLGDEQEISDSVDWSDRAVLLVTSAVRVQSD